MKKYSVSVVFMLRTDRGTPALRPIQARIYHDGKEFKQSPGIYCPENLWDPDRQRMLPRHDEAAQTNTDLNDYENMVFAAHKHAKDNNCTFGAQYLARHTKGQHYSQGTRWKEYAETWEKENRHLYSPSTLPNFRATINLLEQFRPFLMVSEITEDLIVGGFHRFLKTERKNNRNTIQKQMWRLKIILKPAIKKRWIDDPFADSAFPGQETETINCLTEKEVEAISRLRLPSYRLMEIRNQFLLQCYTGMNYADLREFRPEYIVADDDGRKWISKDRFKSDVRALMPLFPKAEAILSEMLFFELGHIRMSANQTLNSNLKKIGAAAKSPFPLTSKVGRTTFGMILLNNGISMQVVSRMLGHKSIATTQRYYAKVRKDLIARETANFDKFGTWLPSQK